MSKRTHYHASYVMHGEGDDFARHRKMSPPLRSPADVHAWVRRKSAENGWRMRIIYVVLTHR